MEAVLRFMKPVRVSRQMGHSSVRFTLDQYAHISQYEDAEVELLQRPSASLRENHHPSL